jgi:hypothetical protein
MNWFKKLLASHNLRLPDSVYPQIDTIVEIIINYCKNLTSIPSTPVQMGIISFVDIYTNQNLNIKIFLDNRMANEELLSGREKNTGDIYVGVYYDIFGKELSSNLTSTFRQFLKNQIIHELSHSVDQKITNINLQNKYNNNLYLLKSTEFDAYSKEITEYIKAAYKNPLNQKMIMNWLKSNNFGTNSIENNQIKNILNINPELFDIINYWRVNKPTYLQKFRQRIINDII